MSADEFRKFISNCIIYILTIGTLMLVLSAGLFVGSVEKTLEWREWLNQLMSMM